MQDSPKVPYIGTPNGARAEAGHLAKLAEALHSDAEMRYPYRTLAPGETWAPEHRPFVIGGTASGGESGWREFCNEVKRIENTAR